MNTVSAIEQDSYDAQTIRDRVRAAGVVGAGGRVFPPTSNYRRRLRSFWLILLNVNRCSRLISN